MNLICAIFGHEYHESEKCYHGVARRACVRCGDKQVQVGLKVSRDRYEFTHHGWSTVGRFRSKILDAEVQSWLRFEDLDGADGGIVEQIRRME
jgi:Prophage protein (DUF1660)